MSRRKKDRKGAVIVELIVVTAMIGTAALAIILSLFYGQVAGLRARHHTLASQIASQEIETIRNTPFNNLSITADGPFIGNPDAAAEALPSGAESLTISYFDQPTNTIKQVIAKVSWVERGTTQSVEYTTLVVNNGL